MINNYIQVIEINSRRPGENFTEELRIQLFLALFISKSPVHIVVYSLS